MNVLLVDAYDSFVYIIDLYLRSQGLRTRVLRCDDPSLDSIAHQTGFVVLGPGPGRPEEAGYPRLIRKLEGRVPILGVCLGHQAIALAYGGRVVRANACMHGKTSTVINDGRGVFAALGRRPFRATRYHSLVANRDDLPDALTISAYAEDDHHVMGLRHRDYPIEGVQFHPESVATEHGASIFTSFVDSYLTTASGRRKQGAS